MHKNLAPYLGYPCQEADAARLIAEVGPWLLLRLLFQY
jgi:hypothetical protein